MMLTDLADACRKSGLEVIELAGWERRGTGQMTGVKTIACHHTAGPATGNIPSLNVLINGHASLAGPLSQLGLARDGGVYVIAAGRCNHAGVVLRPEYGNNWAIGIEAEGTGRDPWPRIQYLAYVKLCRALIDHYNLPVAAVLGHKEICSPRGRKVDPNFGMAQFRTDIFNLQGDDMFEQRDRDLLAQVASKRDTGFLRDQILAVFGIDPTWAPEQISEYVNANHGEARIANRADLGWFRDQMAKRLGFDGDLAPDDIPEPADVLPILEAILGKLVEIDDRVKGIENGNPPTPDSGD